MNSEKLALVLSTLKPAGADSRIRGRFIRLRFERTESTVDRWVRADDIRQLAPRDRGCLLTFSGDYFASVEESADEVLGLIESVDPSSAANLAALVALGSLFFGSPKPESADKPPRPRKQERSNAKLARRTDMPRPS